MRAGGDAARRHIKRALAGRALRSKRLKARLKTGDERGAFAWLTERGGGLGDILLHAVEAIRILKGDDADAEPLKARRIAAPEPGAEISAARGDTLGVGALLRNAGGFLT